MLQEACSRRAGHAPNYPQEHDSEGQAVAIEEEGKVGEARRVDISRSTAPTKKKAA